MSSDDKPQKPLPSAEELNAYLELSAARTKKRLTLAAGNAVPINALVVPRTDPAKLERSLRVANAKQAAGKTGGSPDLTPSGKGAASSEANVSTSREPAWRPFASEEDE